jgi:plasmid stabilization system protein ParE
MTRRLVVRPQAEIDVADAVAWYEDQRAGLGNQLLDEIESVMERVVHSPFQFPQIRDEVRRALLRRFPYSVYFRMSHETVDIIAVLHQHRDPRTWQTRVIAE